MKRPLSKGRQGLRLLWCALLLAACGGEGPTAQTPQAPAEARFASSADAGPPLQYAYDEARRLVAVYDATGASAQYVYDEGGNILEIKRVAATGVGVFDFSPNAGAPGAEVVVTGTGFSATSGSNTVQFNGVGATVSAATSQRLVVTVPAGATTGKVSVTANGQTATSHEDFVVMPPAPPPVISGFTPYGGPTGTKVTVTGTGFSPDLISNRVFVGGVQAHVVSATATQLEATVSRLGATGRVRVSTPYGSATSADDFLVLPTSELPGSADTRLQPQLDGAPLNISLADGTRKALLSFVVSRGEQVSVVVTAVNLGGTAVGSLRIYDSMGTLLNNFSVSGPGVFDLPAAPKDGVYTAVLKPGSTTTGFSATLTLLRAVSGTLVADGPATVFSGLAGQNGRYSISGAAGERLGLGITSVSTTPSGQSVGVSVLKPDGTTLVTCSGTNAPDNCDLPVLPATGPYTILVNPSGSAAATVGLLLSRTVEGSLVADGAASTFSTSRVGQDGWYTFTAGAGVNLALVTSAGTFATYASIRILKPDGSQLTTTTASPNHTATLNFTTTTAGTYGLSVDPYQANTGQLTLKVNTRTSLVGRARTEVTP